MFFKKWLTRKNRPHIEDIQPDQEKIHYIGDIQPGQERIILHFADDLTGRRKTFSVPVDYGVGNLKSQIEKSGVLPYTAWQSADLEMIHEYGRCAWTENPIRELKKYSWGDEIKDTSLRDGDTLHIEYKDAELIRRWGVTNHFLAEYEVIVRWKCFEEALTGNYRIMCHGCDTWIDIERNLIKIDDKFYEFTISTSSWPRHLKYLCQLSKKKRVILFAEAQLWSSDYADAVMYGCPTAGIFKDADKRQSCSVEIVRYE